MARITPARDLSGHVDRFGNISVDAVIGDKADERGARRERRETGASSTPAAVAAFLRDLADDIERAEEGA